MDFVISFIVSWITQILKRYFPFFKDDTSHLAILIVAFLIAVLRYGLQWLPEAYFNAITEIWAGTVLWYEVILKKIKFFDSLDGQKE